MNRKLIAISLTVFLSFSFLPLVAEGAGEIKTFHIVDDLEFTGKPPGTGKDKPSDGGSTQPAQKLPWGVDRIDAELVSFTGKEIKVAVLDTGIDSDHPDLNVAGGINFIQSGRTVDPSKWDDDNGHGTHVAGTIGALDNDIGVVGVAPGVSLYAVKVLDRRGSGSLTGVINGIKWAADNGMDIISMSLSTDYDYQELEDACDYAFNMGVVIVAAAGNDGSSVDYPAAYSSVIAVSATTSSDSLAYFSNRGNQIELSAPGVNIESTWIDGGYNTISGTSMACPHVSGVAALVLEWDGTLSPSGVRNSLRDAENLGDDSGWDNFFGYGLVDAQAATS
ncbi:MAG: S8 family peptidase [Thermoplasmatota archaeon]